MGKSVGRFAVQLTFEIGPANERANVKSSDGCVGDGDEREKKKPRHNTTSSIQLYTHPSIHASLAAQWPYPPSTQDHLKNQTNTNTHTEPKVSFPHQPNRIPFPRRQENKKQNKAIVQHPTTAGRFFRALDNNDDDDNPQNKTKSSPLPRLRLRPYKTRAGRDRSVVIPCSSLLGHIGKDGLLSPGGYKDGNEGSAAGIQAAGRSKQTSNLKSSRER